MGRKRGAMRRDYHNGRAGRLSDSVLEPYNHPSDADAQVRSVV
jgi:hypothetical protein